MQTYIQTCERPIGFPLLLHPPMHLTNTACCRDKYDFLARNTDAAAAAAAVAAAAASSSSLQRTASAAPTAPPMPPTPFKGAGMMNGGGRKIRSAYPVVKLKPTAEQTPFRD